MKDENKPERGLERWEPDRGIFSLRDAMNRLFDESFWDPFENSALSHAKVGFPKVDISETEKEVKVVANIPGVSAENVEIEVEDDYVSISGKIEKESEEEDKDRKYYRFEREYGEFRRELPLPAKVKSDEARAKTKDGILTVTVPKAEESRRKKIEIESE